MWLLRMQSPLSHRMWPANLRIARALALLTYHRVLLHSSSCDVSPIGLTDHSLSQDSSVVTILYAYLVLTYHYEVGKST